MPVISYLLINRCDKVGQQTDGQVSLLTKNSPRQKASIPVSSVDCTSTAVQLSLVFAMVNRSTPQPFFSSSTQLVTVTQRQLGSSPDTGTYLMFFIAINIIPVSYTHLTLPTMYCV